MNQAGHGAGGHPDPAVLLLLAEGELAADVAAEWTGHVSGCPECKARMTDFEAGMARFVQARDEVAVPPPIDWRRFSTRVGARDRALRQARLRRRLGWLAAAAVVFLAVLLAGQRPRPRRAEYFVSLDNEPIDAGIVIRIQSENGRKADVIFASDGRAHAYRWVENSK